MEDCRIDVHTGRQWSPAGRIWQRSVGAVAAAVFVLSLSLPVRAGSYLNRAALLVAQSSHEASYIRARLSDTELASMVHQVAEARLDAAGKMLVPTEVALAHPHLLLTLENYERAMDAAARGETSRFLVHIRRAYEEESVFRSVLKQLGWRLPEG